ncbi:uncharacterized protein BO87DRAFT_401774 [Aspergillus neoniger CBS 115656]|uniref:Uncharacterized protein n=1 Tax=Aspergillus neoniger (strain CBS 115656) TaxID=1448310 RepID=A0A318Y573_ASPNB|nr:hypothetical protein BO87DRAFT_401774 [Aspergillus neoniger CBS 115656]PYH28979.1 hypothetical protein BO87DRAFT_401774 [Aspergillus neoniger CBS 115656]
MDTLHPNSGGWAIRCVQHSPCLWHQQPQIGRVPRATEPSCGGTQSQRIAVEHRGPSGASGVPALLPFSVHCTSSIIQYCSVKEPTSIEVQSRRSCRYFLGLFFSGGPRTQAAITTSPDWESTAFLQVPCLAPAFSAVDRRLFSFLLP